MYKELEMTPSELLNYMKINFLSEVPTEIVTVEDLEAVGKMISQTTNQYAYLCTLFSAAKIDCRGWRRLSNEDKKQYEDAIDRKDIIQCFVDTVKMRYNALSRLITIKQEVNAELKMSELK